LLATLKGMADAGYAYAIIGDAGPMMFFEKCVGAFPIPGSTRDLPAGHKKIEAAAPARFHFQRKCTCPLHGSWAPVISEPGKNRPSSR
jgi:hypothetical protein